MVKESYDAHKIVIRGILEVKAGSGNPPSTDDEFYDLLDDEL